MSTIYVFEKDETPLKPISNAPELPPPVNPATLPTNTPPVYQDISELSGKSKEVFEHF